MVLGASSAHLIRIRLQLEIDHVQVNMTVTCQIVQDRLWGDNHTVFRLKLLSHGSESYPFKDDD